MHWQDLYGTTETSFRIGKGRAILDASGVTSPKSIALQDRAGTVALLDDILAPTRTEPMVFLNGGDPQFVFASSGDVIVQVV